MEERPGSPWETLSSGLDRQALDAQKFRKFASDIRTSDRVFQSVKDKSDSELLTHYGLCVGDVPTRLGVLLFGTPHCRRTLGTSPLVQAIKYDIDEKKVNKWQWDDCSLSSIEMVDAVWREVADFRESYEIAEGLFRRSVSAFDESVVRELLVNALVHRPYTQQGDIYLNLHPDRLEIVNPGRLPIGVTPANLLNASQRRNNGLARVFHDLGLMEKEGSGFNLIYDRLLSQGRPAPTVVEGVDSVTVTVQRIIASPQALRLVAGADAQFQLTQKERTALGMLSQAEDLSSRELKQRLHITSDDGLKHWLGRLAEYGLVAKKGNTAAARYFVEPALLRGAKLDSATSLRRISPERLRALIEEDLARHPNSASPELNRRIGAEIPLHVVRRALASCVESGRVVHQGERRWRTYSLASITS